MIAGCLFSKLDISISKKILHFLRILFDLFVGIYDIIISRPAKPLPNGMLKCGGFFYFKGEGR